MAKAHLTITKTMHAHTGKVRPIIRARAVIDPQAHAFLLENFPYEGLFKRAAYANGFGDAGLQPSAQLARVLANFVKSDACPEVTVRTLLLGQSYEASGLWDAQCFEFVVKRAFDALAELVLSVEGFRAAVHYAGHGNDPVPATPPDVPAAREPNDMMLAEAA